MPNTIGQSPLRGQIRLPVASMTTASVAVAMRRRIASSQAA